MSSKLRKLKQQAFEAARKRDWAGAAIAYGELVEQDKNNPSLQNEYGDVCLKAGDTSKAIRQFLAAAAKYRQTGLLNNAQAVYKKVLRHEPGNVNANWFLAEIRAAQGLLADGVLHTLTFLNGAEEVAGEVREIYQKRCLELLSLYADSDEVLERLERIYKFWRMPLETARVGCLRACVAFKKGDGEAAANDVAALVAASAEIVNYAEYTRWLETSGQKQATKGGFADVNAIDLGPAASPETPAATPVADDQDEVEGPPPVGDADRADAFLKSDEPWTARDSGPVFGDDDEAPAGRDADIMSGPELGFDRDEEGCISIDTDGETSFADLLSSAVASVDEAVAGRAQPVAEPVAPAASPRGHINLLEEILAEEGEDLLRASATEQVSTIASEIGRHLGASAEIDPESQYQQGLVYLELGLYDQAALAFAAAAQDQRFALQAREMWGIALHRSGDAQAALAVLQDGLVGAAGDSRRALGLRYHAGRILEELGRHDEAQQEYRRVHASDAGFADVVQRLRVNVR